MSEQPEATEVVESLTGFDELAIKRAFGEDVEDLKAFASMRALAFVLLRRNGEEKDSEAYQRVMAMPMGEVKAMFSEPDDDRDPMSTGNG